MTNAAGMQSDMTRIHNAAASLQHAGVAGKSVENLARAGALQTAHPRSAVVVTGDAALRHALVTELRGLRWTVREAGGAAAMFALLEQEQLAVVIIDSWLPDLEVRECVRELISLFPALDVLTTDGTDVGAITSKGLFRGEIFHALRQVQERLDTPVWKGSLPEKEIVRRYGNAGGEQPDARDAAQPGNAMQKDMAMRASLPAREIMLKAVAQPASGAEHSASQQHQRGELRPVLLLPELIGTDPRMVEISRRVQLVARRKTTVLVHGPTGTGKELVARAIHRLSGRPAERFVAINCAAIPEALVEAELFGHARGAFTGAVQGRIGRIEAAAGGTLFLDEIGELPLMVQSKLLRFLESGEVQRVGENEVIRVDVRVVAATHRKLGAMAAEGTFRLDLLHRLSVFFVETPPLAGRHSDIDALIAYALAKLAMDEPAKQLGAASRDKLRAHSWPGNVRELEHTLERAWILAGEDVLIGEDCVEFGEALI